jgi:hypothetical protein
MWYVWHKLVYSFSCQFNFCCDFLIIVDHGGACHVSGSMYIMYYFNLSLIELNESNDKVIMLLLEYRYCAQLLNDLCYLICHCFLNGEG